VLEELGSVDGRLVDPVRYTERLHERALLREERKLVSACMYDTAQLLSAMYIPPFSRSFCLGFRKEKRSRKAVSVKSCSGLPW
jgi:hypothetical protein